MVKFGQYKVPFGQQQLTSSGSQQFVDRSQVSDLYARGRDTGIQLWGRLLGDKIEWRVGAFNGNGLTRTINDNDKFQYNARVMFQPNGVVPLAAGLGNSGPALLRGRLRVHRQAHLGGRGQLREERLLPHHHRDRPARRRLGVRRHLQVQGLLRHRGLLHARAGAGGGGERHAGREVRLRRLLRPGRLPDRRQAAVGGRRPLRLVRSDRASPAATTRPRCAAGSTTTTCATP